MGLENGKTTNGLVIGVEVIAENDRDMVHNLQTKKSCEINKIVYCMKHP